MAIAAELGISQEGARALVGAQIQKLDDVALREAVVYVPFLQAAFRTAPLAATDWFVCIAVASSVVGVMDLRKLLFPEAERRRDVTSSTP